MKPLVSMFCLLFACGSFAFSQDDRLVVKKDPSDPKRMICELKYATFKVPEGWQPNRSEGKTQCILTKSSDKTRQFVADDHDRCWQTLGPLSKGAC